MGETKQHKLYNRIYNYLNDKKQNKTQGIDEKEPRMDKSVCAIKLGIKNKKQTNK